MSGPTVAAPSPQAVEVKAGKSYWWCACGLSGKQPFCDGSHKDSGFAPLEYKAEADGTLWMCRCKRTGNAPLCDGSHVGV